MAAFDRQHVLGCDLGIDEHFAIGGATEALGVGVAGPSSGFEAANEKVVEAGIVAEGIFDFVEVNAIALDKRADLTPSPRTLLPPTVEAGAKGPVEDSAKNEMPRVRAVEPAEERLPWDVFDDDSSGLAVAVAGWRGGGGSTEGHGEREGVEKRARCEVKRTGRIETTNAHSSLAIKSRVRRESSF